MMVMMMYLKSQIHYLREKDGTSSVKASNICLNRAARVHCLSDMQLLFRSCLSLSISFADFMLQSKHAAGIMCASTHAMNVRLCACMQGRVRRREREKQPTSKLTSKSKGFSRSHTVNYCYCFRPTFPVATDAVCLSFLSRSSGFTAVHRMQSVNRRDRHL